jgi:sugar lactone lactonase YvrE
VALLVALAFAVPASAAYTYVGQWGSEGSGDGEFNYPGGIATDSSGSVYIADTNNNRIQKFDSSGTFITKWGSLGSGSGQFRSPQGISTDSSGNVYVADTLNYRIQKFSSSGSFITQWGSKGSSNGQFLSPEITAIDSSGNVYVVDDENGRVQKFSSSGTFLARWDSSFSSDNGKFNYPVGIATDSSDNVYVADYCRIQKLTSSGSFITKWGSYGSGNGQFLSNGLITTDSSGNVYVADNGNYRIQKFSSSGVFITKWGSYGSGDGEFDSGSGTRLAIAIDSSGNVYVADPGNSRIQKFSESTVPGKARIGEVTVRGPASIRKGRTYTYKATIQNSGNAQATGVRLVVSGRGIRFNAPVGRINAGATRTVNLRLQPSRTGKVSATFKVTSSNAGSKTVRKTITVRK